MKEPVPFFGGSAADQRGLGHQDAEVILDLVAEDRVAGDQQVDDVVSHVVVRIPLHTGVDRIIAHHDLVEIEAVIVRDPFLRRTVHEEKTPFSFPLKVPYQLLEHITEVKCIRF